MMRPVELAESALLGSLLLAPTHVAEVPWLGQHDFAEAGRGAVFAEIRRQVVGGGSVDASSVAAALVHGVPGQIHPDLVSANQLHNLVTLAPPSCDGDTVAYARMVLEGSIRRQVRGLGVEVTAATLGEPALVPARVAGATDRVLGSVETLGRRWNVATSRTAPDIAPAQRKLVRWALASGINAVTISVRNALAKDEYALLTELGNAVKDASDDEVARSLWQVSARFQGSTDAAVRALGRDLVRFDAALHGDHAALDWVIQSSGALFSMYETLKTRAAGIDAVTIDIDRDPLRVQALPDTTRDPDDHGYWVTVARPVGEGGLPQLTSMDSPALRAQLEQDVRRPGIAAVTWVMAGSALEAVSDAVDGPDGAVHNELLWGGGARDDTMPESVRQQLDSATQLLELVRPSSTPEPDLGYSAEIYHAREAAARTIAEVPAPSRDVVGRAERRLIAAAITGVSIDQLVARFAPDDFAERSTAATWNAITALHDSQQPVNTVTVVWEQQRGTAQHGPGVPVDELRDLAAIPPITVDVDSDLVAAARLHRVATAASRNVTAAADHAGLAPDDVLTTTRVSVDAVRDVAARITPKFVDPAAAAALDDLAAGDVPPPPRRSVVPHPSMSRR